VAAKIGENRGYTHRRGRSQKQGMYSSVRKEPVGSGAADADEWRTQREWMVGDD
jgi:hypothetical protein